MNNKLNRINASILIVIIVFLMDMNLNWHNRDGVHANKMIILNLTGAVILLACI
jgi:hypothetical protein